MPSLETANVGKAVAARVGANIREVRTKLGMTQAQLAAPEFSISYISAIERGKIRPSLKALSVLARRLDVPLTFLLEGTQAGAAEAHAVGFSSSDFGPDQRIDVDLLQANVFIQKGDFVQAEALLEPIQIERIAPEQVYHLHMSRSQVYLNTGRYQEAIVDLRAAIAQGEALNDDEYSERARNLLGKAYFSLYNYTLAIENHLRCYTAIEQNQSSDPAFSLDVINNLAHDYFRRGDLERAVYYYQQALTMLDALYQDSRSFAQKYMDMSQHYKALGKFSSAREYAMQSLAIYEMREEQRLAGMTHLYLGKALEKQDDVENAKYEYNRAIDIERDLNDAVSASQCLSELAELLLKNGQVVEAEAKAQEALAYAQSGGDAQTQGQALITLAQIRHQADDFSSADRYFTQALELLDASNAHEIAASAYFQFANLLEERGEVQRSLTAIKKAYEHQRLGKRGDSE